MKKLITLFAMAFVLFSSVNTSAQCVSPTNLTATYSNNVSTFSWDAVPGAVDYTIEIKQVFDDWAYAEVVATTSDIFYTITGIFHSAALDWRVRTNCNTAASAFTVAQYSVPCPAPSGLTVTNITTTSATLNWIPASGFNNFVSDFVISYRLAGTNNAWTQIGHTFGSSINVSGLLPGTTYEWCVNQTCVNFNSNPVIAHFTTTAPACTAPTGVVFSYNNNVSSFTWNQVPGAIDYSVQIGWAGGNWGTTEFTVPPNTPYTITNLMQGGNFQFRVRANCGSTFSNYTPILFTTPCSAPISLTTTNITTTSATLNWVPAIGNNGNTVFAVGYRLANTNNAWIQIGNTTATSINVTGLTPGTQYEWCVTKVCSSLSSNPIISQFTTTISVACGIPTGLFANDITNNSAVLNWNAINGASSYTLQYRILNTGNWVSINNLSGTSYLLTNCSLMNTTYEFRVKTKCGGVFSDYSSPAIFTTLSCVAYGNNSQEWIDLFKIGSINRVSGAETGGYINTGISTNLVIGSTGNTGQISAGFASTIRNQNYCIYIDLNQNGIYEYTERVFGSALISGAGNINFSFSIPATATPGVTGLRVSMRRNGSGGISPCMTTGFGETEDYIVNLTTVSSRSAVSNIPTDNNSKFETVVRVSPNPSEGIFTISLPKNNQVVFYDVVDLNGAVLQKQNIAGNSVFNIDITNKSKGFYLLRITDQSGKQKTFKLLKN